MTRFATFWVERGTIVAPVDVLRFDDSVYRLLGSNLEALTREPELLLSPDSYRSRRLASATVPGALGQGDRVHVVTARGPARRRRSAARA
jgi:predicted Zn-dependent protease